MRSEDRHPTPERMAAFTDAAVAIALTLLVLPLVELVPEGVRAGEPAGRIITGNLDAIGSFLLGFAVIARVWVVHHRLFGFATRLTRTLVTVNLAWILTITVLPFFVELVSSYGSSALVLRCFVGDLLVSSGLLTALTVLLRRLGVVDGDDSGPPDSFVTGSVAATTNIGLAFLLVLVAPQVSYYALFLLFLDPLTTRLVDRIRHR
ncbi:TMEM175 family protein [Actinomycetospora chiangmaiensis]|uniref:TMEM175 family protein n=1 Tax=Actinomycetospora chiangmaiensis TaxID=402650 RepID=UPI0003A3C3DA|nr:TMEM175 family protein [Actinomycetospora chiangmaiensis]